VNSISPTCTTTSCIIKKVDISSSVSSSSSSYKKTKFLDEEELHGVGDKQTDILVSMILGGQATTCASEVSLYFSTQGPPVRCCWENTHLPFPLHCCLSACAGCCGSATSIATTTASSAIILPKQIHPPTHPET
jgi:hypothetical protein